MKKKSKKVKVEIGQRWYSKDRRDSERYILIEAKRGFGIWAARSYNPKLGAKRAAGTRIHVKEETILARFEQRA